LDLSATPATHDAAIDLDVLRALATLPMKDRAAVVLHHLCDVPVAEVARTLGASPGATAVRLHRARARLAEVLREENHVH
jgi:RNA polymerase sigma-70 factor (ECF subfamily)